MMGQTLAQKIIARASERDSVSPGEIVTCKVDLAMFHDSSGPRRLEPMLKELDAQIWDPSKVVLVIDHYLPASDTESRKIIQIARDFAHSRSLPHRYEGEGICHVVLPQKGHLRPGLFAVGGDSHSPTGGAFGAYMFGIGSTEMLGVMVRGELWVKVPQTIRLQWSGLLTRGVMAKDMMLAMLGKLGMDGGRYEAIEYSGDTIETLSMQERMTLCNMSAELGAQTALIAPDATTQAWLAKAGVSVSDEELLRWQSDADAPVEVHTFSATDLTPQVAAPHSPDNVSPVGAVANTAISVAYIGACTGAKLDDLRAASEVLRGRRVAEGVQLLIAPASTQDWHQASAEGIVDVLRQAGAQVLPTACGACAGYGGTVPEGSTVISSTARNFKGRMGPATAQVYLASPATVAASALRGSITDPREVLG